jgi:DNA polymerase III subunit delta
MKQSASGVKLTEKTVSLGDNYLLLGEDAWLRDQATDTIKSAIRKDNEIDIAIVYCDDVNASQINDVLDSYSIFASQKVVILRNAEMIEKKELETLARYFSDPASNQTLIISAIKIDGRIADWKKIKDSCINVICDNPIHKGDLGNWLTEALIKTGKAMTNQARLLFLDKVELDYANAQSELQKLIILVQDHKQISENDVIKCVGYSRTGTQTDFIQALGKRNIKTCLELLERMLSSDYAALQILAIMNRFYMVLYKINILKQNHLSISEIINAHLTELYPSQRQEYINISNNIVLKQLKQVFNILLETDTKLKLSYASESVLLVHCIVNIMAA